MSGGSSDVPVWVRATVATTGFALIVSSASDGLIDHPNSAIAVSMLGVGGTLLVIGPLMR